MMHNSATLRSSDFSPATETSEAELLSVLQRFELPIAHRALVRAAMSRARRSGKGLDRQEIGAHLEQIVSILLAPRLRRQVLAALSAAGFGPVPVQASPVPKPSNQAASDQELVAPIGRGVDPSASRALAREACLDAGLSRIAMQRVLNAVGELTRNISTHAGEGRIRFRSVPQRTRVEIFAEDEGPGIAELDAVLSGRYRGRNGRARGLVSVQRLASQFEIETSSAGTRVALVFEGR